MNKLLECSTTLISLVLVFLEDDRGKCLEEDFHARILREFDAFERETFEMQLSPAHVIDAKYAIAAFIDELIMYSNWKGRSEWMGNPLQLQFFGEHSAGDGFYQRLSHLRQGGSHNIDVVEVYYICLQLGFEGVYRVNGMEKLLALQVDLRGQIDATRGVIDPRLSPDAHPKKNIVTQVSRHVPFWVIVSVTLAIIFFVYLGYSFAIDRQVGTVITKIQENQQILAEGKSL